MLVTLHTTPSHSIVDGITISPEYTELFAITSAFCVIVEISYLMPSITFKPVKALATIGSKIIASKSNSFFIVYINSQPIPRHQRLYTVKGVGTLNLLPHCGSGLPG
jgi:hypothetical protein